ncbi:FAD-dependent tricarballylate dehydrogenase TcuA [Pelagibius sp. 7325]|uniref:FAD-dependent tricarballylate dehydrogenase TcuA n=1 Tax=Pelagibius sp. 7325 TaxID=3131994 RepID=UPI0030EB4E10
MTRGELRTAFDVLVIGGGNAGLSAAIMAAEAGRSVCILEGAPRFYRGGNSRHTRNLRAMHNAPTSVLTDAYEEEEYYQDLLRVTKGKTTEKLARLAIRESQNSVPWLEARGVRFQKALSGTLHLGRTNAFFLGGGKALVNALYRHAESLGVVVHYEAPVEAVHLENGFCRTVTARLGDAAVRDFSGRSVVFAAGGFQANIPWLKESWGAAADNFLIRGTPYNTGEVLKQLLDQGTAQVGDPQQCHAVAIDGRAPKYDGGICTRVDCVSLGIVVNEKAERFYDEGEDFWPKRYAIWGRLVAAQPNQVGHVIIDQQAIGLFMPPVFPAVTAGSIEELGGKIGLDPQVLAKTVADYNAAVHDGSFDHTELDNCRTEGLTPPKTHWARRLDTPPFYAYTLAPGITFTYLGVEIDEHARVLMADGRPSANMFAAGEIMAGNVLGEGYLAGIGMTIGGVFGRIAGEEAARHVAQAA